MITLNLISPEQKKLLKVKQLFLWLRNLSSLILFFIIIITIIIILVNYSLIESNVLDQNIYFQSALNEREVQSINQKLKDISSVQAQHRYWPEIIIPLINLIPDGIELKNWEIDEKSQTVKLNGMAKTRNDYLNLITTLQNEKKFKDFNPPLENLLYKENINFDLVLTYLFNS